MSTRFVWNRNAVNYEYAQHGDAQYSGSQYFPGGFPVEILVADSPEDIGLSFNSNNVAVPSTIRNPSEVIAVNDFDWERYFPANTPVACRGDDKVFFKPNSQLLVYISQISDDPVFCVSSGRQLEVHAESGSYIATVSNAASSTYPQDGVSGNYWYELQGSDNIDAAAVGYSNQAPMGGQPITINVTAGTGKVYGGNVRYTYQVQLNGGSWQTIATNSTALSQSYTIPAGTTSFAARVQASDDLGFTSSTYTTGTTLTVTNNVPPTAPSGISFTEPVAGSTCDITWGAATDSDGTVTGYELERNVDGGDSWTQIYSGSALSYEDNVDPDWATVNYRVRAVDDDGDAGAYATGTAQAINDGWLYFSGPDEDMGAQGAPFDFTFAINSTPAGAQGIDVHVYLDDDEIYSGTPDAAEQVSVHVDMRPMRSGKHVIVTTAECGELLGVNKVCKFTVPEFELPEGGRIEQLRNSDGMPIFPQTLISGVRGAGGQSVAGVLEQSYYSTYVGTGTSGQGNPCQTRLAFHPSLMIIQASGNSAAAIGYWVRTADEDAQDQGNMVVYNGTTQTLIPVRWDEETMTISYYGNSAAEQLNASGVVYGIRIL